MKPAISRLKTRLAASTAVPAPPIEPVAISITDAILVSSVSRSELYRLLGAQKIQAVKCGTRTLILVDSLRQYLSTLPPAKFGKSAGEEDIG
jgi:hypothetical protein